MFGISGVWLIFIVIAIVAFTFAITALKVVPQQNAWVVERLGRFHGFSHPGLNSSSRSSTAWRTSTA